MTFSRLFDLTGRKALVTGSTRGIGRAMALGLAECGAAVVVHGTRSGARLDDALGAVRALGAQGAAVAADLAQPDAAERLVAESVAAIGAPDILVINASVQLRTPWSEVTRAEAEHQLQVNFHSTLRLIQCAAPHMRAARWGRILTIGSVQQERPHPDMIVYASTKAAVLNLVRNLARQLAPDGVTVNNLAPGVILTERNTAALADPAYAARVRDLIPARAFGEPQDCVGAALLLCSDAGRYITGADLAVDGGMRL